MQVKLLRDAKKVSPAGTPASRGMGFVEFSEHEHALCALRQLNNNPHLFGKPLRWHQEQVNCCSFQRSTQLSYSLVAKGHTSHFDVKVVTALCCRE